MKQFLKGIFVVLFLLTLIYMAVLFTGVGDTWVYRNTGYDVTGMAKQKYHQEQDQKNRDLREKLQKMPKTAIEIDSTKYNFGRISEGEKVNHTYKITNKGPEKLVITDVKVGCGCTLAHFTEEPTAPGEVAEVSIIFDSKSKKGHTQKALHVYANTADIPFTLSFEADVQMNH